MGEFEAIFRQPGGESPTEGLLAQKVGGNLEKHIGDGGYSGRRHFSGMDL